VVYVLGKKNADYLKKVIKGNFDATVQMEIFGINYMSKHMLFYLTPQKIQFLAYINTNISSYKLKKCL